MVANDFGTLDFGTLHNFAATTAGVVRGILLGAGGQVVTINSPSDPAFQLIGVTTNIPGDLSYPPDVGPPPGVGTPLTMPITPPVNLQPFNWFSFRFLPKTAGKHTATFSFYMADGTGFAGTLVGVAVASQCFIATAAYGNALDPHVQLLREYRDDVLLKSKYSQKFEALLETYYVYSPPIANSMVRSRWFKIFLQYSVVLPIVFFLGGTPAFLRLEKAKKAIGQ